MSPRIELYTQLVCESVLGVDTLNDTLALGAEFSTAARWNGTEPFTSNQQLEAHQDSASIWATSPELSAQLALHPLAPLAPGPVVFLSSPRPDPESSMPHEPPRPTKECRTNPVVQSAVAQLQLRMVLAMGVLSALTTGWWGGLSDRKGRTLVLRMAVLGLMTTDAAFFAVALFRQYLPFGYNFLIIGMIVEGLVGGYSTMMAAHQVSRSRSSTRPLCRSS